MRLSELESIIHTPIFSDFDVKKHFPHETKSQINIQLSRMVSRGDLVRLKRGIFMFPNRQISEFVIANSVYKPSYISLETALNIYGLIPDIAANITSVTPITSKVISTSLGTFLYAKLRSDLYFGFQSIKDEESKLFYNVALPEKALLDYIYIRKVKELTEYRLNIESLNKSKLREFSVYFPNWVQRVI